jgi:alkyl sulfatase BDS1-like metallo-beta-lactamase superfamily hydrolase
MEQMGYQAESATWRNAYLFGAQELRRGMTVPAAPARAGKDIVRGLSLDLFFDFLGVRLNGDKAEGKTIVVNWTFPDFGERYALTLQNCALTYLADRHAEAADATVTLDRATLNGIILRELSLPDAMADGTVRVEGNAQKLAELFGLLDEFTMAFDVIEPRKAR